MLGTVNRGRGVVAGSQAGEGGVTVQLEVEKAL